MARNRIIYASQSVIVDGDHLYRVQTLGSATTFTSTDLFELGQQDIIDVVDDVPTVALTLDTNDWGTVRTAAAFARVSSDAFDVTATVSNANLAVVSGTTDLAYYHGVSLANYGVAGSEFDLWAPVQTESALGTADDLIDQTMFLARCFLTGINLSYSVGGEATENYTAEADNKMWLLNDGRFVSQEHWTAASGVGTYNLGIVDTTNQVATLSDNNLAFLYVDPATGRRSLAIDHADGTRTYVPVVLGAATATEAGYAAATNVVTLPGSVTVGGGDVVKIRYAADAYATAVPGDSNEQHANYFTPATDANTGDHSNVGGLRQGQIEIYLVDPDASTDYEMSLRLQTVTIAAALTREPLSELGHLKPYDRPVTFPVEITTTVEATAGDLETFARFAGKEAEYDAGTLIDLTIDHLLQKDNLILVVMIYDQTDVEAGGTGAQRKVLKDEMVGKAYWVDGVRSVYAAINPSSPEREYPLKTVIVPALKSTTEEYSLAQGSNATQTFGFRSTNRMFMVKGYVPFDRVVVTPGMQNN